MFENYFFYKKFRNTAGKTTSRVVSNRNSSVLGSKVTPLESIISQAYTSTKQAKKPESHEESQKKTLIMVLWVSVIFSSSRLVFAVANLFVLFMENTPYNLWGSAFNYFYNAIVYISYLFVYMKTNKLFRKKFYQIFLRKEVK